MRDYELTNLKEHGALYINFESYNVTTDRRPIYNAGNLVLSGTTNESKSNWACIQAKGQLRFNDFKTEWLWAFSSKDAEELSRFDANNSTWGDGAKKLPPLIPTKRKPTADVPRRMLALELPEIKSRFLAEVRKWEDDVIGLEIPAGAINILVHKNITTEYITAVLRRREHPLTVISAATVQASHPKDKVALLSTRLENTWVMDDLKVLTNNPDWQLSFLNRAYANKHPTQLLILSSSTQEAKAFKDKFGSKVTVNITVVAQD